VEATHDVDDATRKRSDDTQGSVKRRVVCVSFMDFDVRASPTGATVASAWIENASAPCFSETRYRVWGVRSDANASHMCGTFAFRRTLRGRA
jgi:hypothetical protein